MTPTGYEGYSGYGKRPDYSQFDRLEFIDAHGVTYSKVKMTPADTVKTHEIMDQIKISKLQNQLTVHFSLPPARAKKLASLTMQMQKVQPHNMTAYKFNQYITSVTGSDLDEIKSSIELLKTGNTKPYNRIIKRAAKINNISIDHANKLKDLFIKN